MKKFFTVLFIVFLLSSICMLTGCDKVELVDPADVESTDSDIVGNNAAFRVKLVVEDSVYETVETDGKTISMPENPTRENYIFDGWFWDKNVWKESFTLNSLFDRPLSADPEYRVYAKWKGVSCTVNFYVDLSPVTVEYGSSFKFDRLYTTDYTFEGWYCIENGADIMLTDDYGWGLEKWSRTDNITVYPRMLKEVTFDLDGGEGIASQKYVCAKAFGTLPTPTKSGYTFDGWRTPSGMRVNADTVFDGDEMAFLCATWKVSEYSVTFNAVNGETARTLAVRYGEHYSFPEEPQKDWMTFVGWYTQPDGAGERIDADSIFSLTENQQLYAHWQGDLFKVTFVEFGGQIAAEREIAYGESYNLNLVYQTGPDSIKYLYCTVPGYDFQGWYTEPDGGGKKLSYSDVLTEPRDHSIYAYYTVSDPKVTTVCSNASYVAYNSKHKNIVAYEQTSDGYELVVYDRNLNKKYTAWSGAENLYAYDTDSDYIVLAYGSSIITVLNIEDGSLHSEIDCSSWPATTVAMDGDIVIVCWGNDNALIKFYDLKNGTMVEGESPNSMYEPILTVNREDHIVYASSVGLTPAALVYYSTQTGKILYEAPREEHSYNSVTYFDGTHVMPSYRHFMRDAITGEIIEDMDFDKYGGQPPEPFRVKSLYRYDENYVLFATAELVWGENNRFTAVIAYRLYDTESGELLHVVYCNAASNKVYIEGHFVIFYTGELLSVYDFGEITYDA